MVSDAVDLAKSAMEAIQRSRARKGAMRVSAADEVRSLARLTEATRIALHRVQSQTERRELTARDRIQLAVADLETVTKIWTNAWADVRFDLDRYLDGSVVEVLRSLRHEALVNVDSVIHQLDLLEQETRRPGPAINGARQRPGRLSEVLGVALAALDRVSSGLTMAHDLVENGGVGSSGR